MASLSFIEVIILYHQMSPINNSVFHMVLDSDIALDYFSKGFHQERKCENFMISCSLISNKVKKTVPVLKDK